MDHHPGIRHHLLTGCMTLIVLEQHSRFPETGTLVTVLVLPMFLGLTGGYCGALVRRINQQQSVATWWSVFHWAAFPCAVAIMCSSAATRWPATVRFELSRPQFEEYISTVTTGKSSQEFPRRIGLYWIESVKDREFNYANGTGKIGFVIGMPILDECGLLFDSSDPRPSHYLTIRISKCWYVTEW